VIDGSKLEISDYLQVIDFPKKHIFKSFLKTVYFYEQVLSEFSSLKRFYVAEVRVHRLLGVG
jgi:hypothetical protein